MVCCDLFVKSLRGGGSIPPGWWRFQTELGAGLPALTSLLEPLLICFLGACVGGMVIALYMPMFNIIKLIK